MGKSIGLGGKRKQRDKFITTTQEKRWEHRETIVLEKVKT